MTQMTQSPMLKYFAIAHLPTSLHGIVRMFGDVARGLDEQLPHDDPEGQFQAMMQKLVEAKDCAVRLAISSNVGEIKLPVPNSEIIGPHLSVKFLDRLLDELENNRDGLPFEREPAHSKASLVHALHEVLPVLILEYRKAKGLPQRSRPG